MSFGILSKFQIKCISSVSKSKVEKKHNEGKEEKTSGGGKSQLGEIHHLYFDEVYIRITVY